MSKYVHITQDQMEAALGPEFKRLDLPNTYEIVYGKRADVDDVPVTIRVYSSLEPEIGSREVGKDAIRVSVYCRVNVEGETKIRRIGTSKRVNRVPGWEDRLKKRIERWQEMLGPHCRRCGAPTVVKLGKYGKFYGCVLYPECRTTAPI